MIDYDAIALRMYSKTPTPTVLTASEPPVKQETEATEKSEPEAVTEEPSESIADRLYNGDAGLPVDGNYLPAINETFDAVEKEARESGNEENVKAVFEGREVVNTALREFGVGVPAAREITQTFSKYRGSPLDIDSYERTTERTIAALRAKWGNQYETKMNHVRDAYDAACNRIPWFADEMDLGAGADIRVIEHLATIGSRLGKKGKS